MNFPLIRRRSWPRRARRSFSKGRRWSLSVALSLSKWSLEGRSLRSLEGLAPAIRCSIGVMCAVVFGCFLSGCVSEMAAPERESLGTYRELTMYDTIDLAPFLDLIPETPFDAVRQKALREDYKQRWFSPWTSPGVTPDLTQLKWGLNFISQKTFYRENKRPVDAVFFKKTEAQMALATFPNKQGVAVAVRYTHLRYVPDHGMLFETPDDFPFDALQVTSLGPATPLRLWHVSRDGLWAYVDAPFASGWMPVLDLAMMTPKETDWVMSSPLYSVMQDNVPALDKSSHLPVVSISIGQQYPGIKSDLSQVYIPSRQANGQAKWTLSVVPSGALQPFGKSWSRDAVIQLVTGIFGEPYGWGGMFFHRDCSAMIRDVVAPFGIWLPRNSGAQAKHGGRFVSLAGLSLADKKQLIMAQGRPFLTLLWLKGHVMLYVGSPYGEPMAFHNIWAVRVRDPQGRTQKVIIGRTVITDLEPGKSLPDFDSTQSLLTRIEGMTFLGE